VRVLSSVINGVAGSESGMTRDGDDGGCGVHPIAVAVASAIRNGNPWRM
jgi:hypothetical protein